ncbi:MAG: BamA/TamA family outer membrane protein [Gemmatimonadota bacterium]|nr:BamA/TamA family outer membrane protein [Gemmatimonadota bacterium]
MRFWKGYRPSRCLRTRFSLVLAGALFLAPAAVNSQQTPASSRPEVVNLTLKGVKVMRTDELLQNIYTTASYCNSFILKPFCWVSKAKYFYTRKYLDHKELERDVLRIRIFYWKRGYRDTEVDTAVVSRGSNKVGVTFMINEGPATVVSNVIVEQATALLSQREINRRVSLGKDGPLNLIKLDSTRYYLQTSLFDQGYADAVVDTSVVVDSASRTAVVKFTLDPKYKTTVEDIVINGNADVSARTISKSLTFHIGDVFRRSEMLRSQRALYESNLFRRAAIEPRPPIDIATPDSAKVIVVTVQEAPPREARMSAGFNTVDFFQVEGRFTHYNFLGAARRLDIQGAVGNLLASSLNGRGIFHNASQPATSSLSRYFVPTYNASIDLREPWFGSPHNELALSLFSHRRSAPGIYIDRGYGTSLTFTRDLLERAPASLNYRFEISKVDAGDVYFCINYGVCDVPTLEALRGNQKLSPFAITSSIDRTNDPFSPNRGFRVYGSVEHASALTASDFRYNRATADGAAFMQVRKRGAIGVHARVGWVNSLGSTSQAVGVSATVGDGILHPRKRFYAGGSHSVRGFGENQLGPRVLTIPVATLQSNDTLNVACASGTDVTACDPNGNNLKDRDFVPRPLGGNFVVEGSVEARFPVWQQLIGAVFVDAGMVSQRTAPTLPKRRGAITPGFGVRYSSPVGPIRADIGINPGARESLPVVTENLVNGQKTLVTLQQRRIYAPTRGGGILNKLVLHLSIGEAF